MRKLITVLSAFLAFAGTGQAIASPVPGYESFYTANYAACTLPNGTVAACETAINNHVSALVGGGVDTAEANNSFTALRSEVFSANSADEDFRAQIDALFEQLLPNSGAVTAPTGGAADNLGDGDEDDGESSSNQ